MDAKQIANAASRKPDAAQPITDADAEKQILGALGLIAAPFRAHIDPALVRYVRELLEDKAAAQREVTAARDALRGLAIRQGSGVLSCALCNSVWRPHEGERHDDDCKAKP